MGAQHNTLLKQAEFINKNKMVNKLVYRMPVMIGLRMAARKYIDSDDEQTTLYIRVAYGLIQFFMLCTAFFLYSKARTYNQTNKEASKTIYIPIKPGILADEETKSKKKYKETTYGEHILSTIISDIKSMLFRICFTSGLHIFRGVVIGLLIQSFMGPLGLFDSPLMNFFFFGESKVFEEKEKSELESDAEIVDGDGNVIEIKKD